MSKIIFYDLETTGVNPNRNSVHQIAGIVEIDGIEVERFNIKTRPHHKAEIEKGAMKVCGVTRKEVKVYQHMSDAFNELEALLGKYINKYDKRDKAYLCGYNNRAFDDVFLRRWFEQNGSEYIGSWFWTDTLDTLVLASQYLMPRRKSMPSFKLKRVAMTVGIDVDESRLHDASYDVELTRAVYQIVTGLEIEMR